MQSLLYTACVSLQPIHVSVQSLICLYPCTYLLLFLLFWLICILRKTFSRVNIFSSQNLISLHTAVLKYNSYTVVNVDWLVHNYNETCLEDHLYLESSINIPLEDHLYLESSINRPLEDHLYLESSINRPLEDHLYLESSINRPLAGSQKVLVQIDFETPINFCGPEVVAIDRLHYATCIFFYTYVYYNAIMYLL